VMFRLTSLLLLTFRSDSSLSRISERF